MSRLRTWALVLLMMVGSCIASVANERKRPSLGAAREPHADLPIGRLDHLAGLVDTHFETAWAAAGVTPASAIIDDATFLRRASLVLNGVPATVDEVETFLGDRSPSESVAERRQKKVDELLTRSRYADYWGFRLRHWITDMREIPGQSTNVGMLYFYARQAMAENRSWRQIARDFLATDGDITQHGYANFGMYFDCEANEMADAAGRLFMGVNLACAQCHNDPHQAQWTQEAYWGLAAYFARVHIIQPSGKADGDYEKRFPFLGPMDTAVTTLPGGDSSVDGHWGDIRAVVAKKDGDVKLPDPEHEKVILPTPLGAEPVAGIDSLSQTRTEHFVDWLVSAKNPYFARAAVNRMWHELIGRGFVDRPDGFTPAARVRHKELLGRLAWEFAERDHDLKWLMRTIVLSRVFQLPHATDAEQETAAKETWHCMPIRRLNGDQWHDSILRVSGEEDRLYRLAAEVRPLLEEERAARIKRHHDAKETVDSKQAADTKSVTALTDEQRQKLDGARKKYNQVGHELNETRERARQGMSPTNESLMRMNGELVARALDNGDAAGEVASLPTPEARLERVYRQCLGRSPRPDERDALVDAVREATPESVRDVIWTLLQTTEFQTY